MIKQVQGTVLVEVYLSAHDLPDLSTKSSCLAWILSALNIVDSSGQIEEKEKLGEVATDELEDSIENLLAHTG